MQERSAWKCDVVKKSRLSSLGRAAAPAAEMLVGQGKAVCFIKGFEA